MKRFKSRKAIALVLGLAFVLTSCGGGTKTTGNDSAKDTKATDTAQADSTQKDAKPSGSGKMTEVGTPRTETLIVDSLDGKVANPNLMNPYLPGGASMSVGLHQLVHSHLWEIDTVKGEQFPDLAAEMPQPTDSSNTKFTFKLREGLYWSDGTEFTADDVAYTGNMLLDTPELSYSASFSSIVKSIAAQDKYTIQLETVIPQAKLSSQLGVTIWGHSFYILPKHIWEKEDPLTFQYSYPLSLSAYTLSKRDPEGYWFLYEKREDWERTDVGQIVKKEPGPQYILFKSYGTEEKRIMAAINHDMDVLQDITPESWDILKQKNEYAKAWYNNFPYADTNDPCERGMAFNCAVAPYDNPEVRWALALATDIKSVSMATFGGMMRVSALQVPPTDVLQDTYHKPMLNWLQNFALDDGYKPFDESYANDMVEMLKGQGIEGLPSDPQTIVDTFGVGWWKYDTDQASKMLEKNGFTKGSDGKWKLPDGSPWQMTIAAPANFEIQSMRLAFAVADAWRKFGVDVNVQQMDSATFWNAESTGNFQVGSYWPSCGIMPDTSMNMAAWHEQFVVPVGELSSGNRSRWKNTRVSTLLDELAAIPINDPSVVAPITEINQEFVKGIPFLPMFGTSKFVPVDTYYWEGFQTEDNQFEGPWWWWSQFKFYTPHYSPTGKE